MTSASVDLDDIQGLLRFGYKHHTQASYLLLQVSDRIAARAWLASVRVASAASFGAPPETALQIALSRDGLQALGVADDIVHAFSPEFVAGLGHDPSQARRLGDVGSNAPEHWQWGTGQKIPHVLVLLFALPGRLAAFQSVIEAQCAAGFTTLACLTTSDMDGVEPFGFSDGISQPQLDWERTRAVHDQEQPRYSNLSCLGEYLLGYPNEYGGYTDRPLLAAHRDSQSLLPRAEDQPAQADLGRNGSYLVLRQLRQDVHSFWQFADAQAGGNAARRERLAASLLGRTRAGEPIVIETDDPNAFDYQADPQGLRCPLGAHVRRANPRNGDLPAGDPGPLSWLARTLGLDARAREQDLVASTRFHRLLRRGREYGMPVAIPDALSGAAGSSDTGLHFICLGANLARQFEFVQAAWMASTRFNGLRNESDPLLGAHAPAADGASTNEFSIPQASGPDQRLCGLPQFVRVLGGAYFFLPGLRALRYLAQEGAEGQP